MSARPLTRRTVYVIGRTTRWHDRARAEKRPPKEINSGLTRIIELIDRAFSAALDGEDLTALNHVRQAEAELSKLERAERADVVRRAFLPGLAS